MTVLITGAARGLGRAMLDQMVAQGRQVYAVDLDCTPLADIQDVTCITANLAQPSEIDTITELLHDKLDCVIHAAGISATGAFEDIPWPNQKAVLDVNFAGPVRLTQALLAGHLNPKAKLCFVSSLSSYVSYPGAAVYAGSKDGLTSYARSLGKSKKLSVTVAFPGPLRTDHASRYAPDNSEAAIARRMTPEDAAKIILKDIQKGKSKSLPGVGAKLAALAGTIAPGPIGRAMRKAIFEKLDKVRI